MDENNQDASLELNKILVDLVKEKNKSIRLPWIVCIVVSACYAIVMCAMLWFFSSYEFYTETVTQDTHDNGGNNVYLPGEQAQYNEIGGAEDGETNN